MDPDPKQDPQSSIVVDPNPDPDPHTINADPHHCFEGAQSIESELDLNTRHHDTKNACLNRCFALLLQVVFQEAVTLSYQS